MCQAFGDGDGHCQISLWPHHAIRPAQPNSRRSHFLYLRRPSSRRAWSFPRAPRPRRWTSYWHSSTSSTRPSLPSADQEWSFSSSSRTQRQKHISARSLPGFRPSDAGRVGWPNSLSDRTGSCRCSIKGAGPSQGACDYRARTKRIAPRRSHHEGGRFSGSRVLRMVRHTTSGTNSCGHCDRTQRSGSQRYEHRRIQKRIVNTVIGARRKFNERFCSANAGRHRALGANYQGERVHYRVIGEGNGTFLAAATSASLIGRLGSSAFRLSTAPVSMSLTGSCFSSESARTPFHHGVRGRGGTIFGSALPLDER